MDVEEAKAWMRGERSTVNHHLGQASNRGEDLVSCAREDAALTEQAYWVLKAHHEGLIEKEGP